MKDIVSILLSLLLLSSCTETSTLETSGGNINSGIPVYKKDDTVYYCEVGEIYKIIAQKDETVTLETLERYNSVTSLFVDDKYLYYTSIFSRNVQLLRKNLDNGNTETLFSHQLKNLLVNDYIYVFDDTVYYFIPNDGLWKITGDNTELILEGARDCVIAGNMIYYSKNGNMYSQSIDTKEQKVLITKEEIFSSGQNDKLLLQTLGDGYPDNLLIHNDKLYFLVTDWYMGGIFSMDFNGENFTCVNPEFRVRRFMFDQNGHMYLNGTNMDTQIRGLYKISDKIEFISKDVRNEFYINNGCYFYKRDNMFADDEFTYIE